MNRIANRSLVDGQRQMSRQWENLRCWRSFGLVLVLEKIFHPQDLSLLILLTAALWRFFARDCHWDFTVVAHIV